MERTQNKSSGLRVVVLSAISGFTAPFVFVSVIVLRKAEHRVGARYRFWNKRLQREISRWT